MNALPILLDNPVLTREMRRRMRGKAMIYSLITYVGVLCLVTFFILLVMSASLLQVGPSNVGLLFDRMKSVGQVIFTGMWIIQSILVLIMAPAITASLITAERERGTADFLRVTTLPPSHFIVGAFLSTILYVILLLGCALPIVSITMLFGGRAPSEVLLTFGALLVGSIVLSSLGIYTSSIRQKSRNAQGTMIIVAVAFIFLAFNAGAAIRAVTSWYDIQSNVFFGQGSYPFFYWNIPDWLFVGLIPLIFSFFMLVVAGRKVYNIQNRPLNYTQFLIVATLCLGTSLALFWTTPNTAAAAFNVWFVVSLLLFLLAPLILCVHYVEVGGDNWRIHQRLPLLAVLDDSIVFLLLFTAGWWLIGRWCFQLFGMQYAHLYDIFVWAIAPPFIFLALVGRLLAHRFYHRHIAFRSLLAGVVICWVLAPIFIQLFSFGNLEPRNYHGGLLFFSPAFSLAALIDTQAKMLSTNSPPPMFSSWPGHFQSFVYLVLSAPLYLILLRKNWRAKRELDCLDEETEADPPEFPDLEPVKSSS